MDTCRAESFWKMRNDRCALEFSAMQPAPPKTRKTPFVKKVSELPRVLPETLGSTYRFGPALNQNWPRPTWMSPNLAVVGPSLVHIRLGVVQTRHQLSQLGPNLVSSRWPGHMAGIAIPSAGFTTKLGEFGPRKNKSVEIGAPLAEPNPDLVDIVSNDANIGQRSVRHNRPPRVGDVEPYAFHDVS